jgi:ATP-dependent RNA helicase RhlE
MSFNALGLLPELTRALADRNYLEPTPVQARVIPEILAGRDVLAGAQTGTGKTAGFTLPILQRLHAVANPSRSPRALILVPTRELAAQVAESIKSYGKYLQQRTALIFGGVSINPQIEALRRGTDIIVATPGRLLDHAQQGTVDLRQIEVLVLDEADRMLDMGFIADIRRVIKQLPTRRQNLMFSATYSDDIRKLAQSLLRDPVEVEVARRNAAVESVEQHVYHVPKDQKRALLSHLIKEGSWSQVLVFTRTKHGANRLAKQLEQDGIRSAAIHGNKSQSARTAALADFKNYRVQALVATEVAARGLDIKELPHVVNYELPNVPEDYVHRIGRTGRAGASGIAVSLVSSDERDLLRDVERLLRKTVTQMPLPAFAPAPPPLREHEERYRDPRAQRNNGNRPQRGRSNGQRQGNSAGSQPNGQRTDSGQGNGNRAPQNRQQGPRPAQGQFNQGPRGEQRPQRQYSEPNGNR